MLAFLRFSTENAFLGPAGPSAVRTVQYEEDEKKDSLGRENGEGFLHNRGSGFRKVVD